MATLAGITSTAPTYTASYELSPQLAQPIISPEIIGDIQIQPSYYSVITQDPLGGTQVPRGSTVYVQFLDLGQVSFGQVDAISNPKSLDTVSLAQATQIIEASPELKEAVINPEVQLEPQKAAELINVSSAQVLSAPLQLDTTDSLLALDAFRTLRLSTRL